MGIPYRFDPLGTLGKVQLVDAYYKLKPGQTMLPLESSYGLTLAQSDTFEWEADIVLPSGLPGAWAVIYNGGYVAVGWWGLQCYGQGYTNFYWSNNNGNPATFHDFVRLDHSYRIVINNAGLTVDGAFTARPGTPFGEQPLTSISPNRLIPVKRWTFKVGGVALRDIFAAQLNGRPVLYDRANNRIYDAE